MHFAVWDISLSSFVFTIAPFLVNRKEPMHTPNALPQNLLLFPLLQCKLCCDTLAKGIIVSSNTFHSTCHPAEKYISKYVLPLCTRKRKTDGLFFIILQLSNCVRGSEDNMQSVLFLFKNFTLDSFHNKILQLSQSNISYQKS